MNSTFSLPVRVYIEDTDAGGIVYYVNYLKYLERARTERLRILGLPKPAVLAEGMLLVVASVSVNYLRAARLDDVLDVSADIRKVGRTYVLFEQKVHRDGQCLLAAEVKIACVTRDTMKPSAFPESVTHALKQLQTN